MGNTATVLFGRNVCGASCSPAARCAETTANDGISEFSDITAEPRNSILAITDIRNLLFYWFFCVLKDCDIGLTAGKEGPPYQETRLISTEG